MDFVYGAVTLYGSPFQTIPLSSTFVTLWGADAPPITSHNPELATPSGYHTSSV